MLHGFFDDSGKESDAANRIVCIAGYISGSAQLWNGLAELWKHCLLTHGLEWLHMKDFLNPESSEYADLGWDWDKKRSVLEDFCQAIKMSKIAGFAVALDLEAWRQLPPEFVKQRGTAQEFCFSRLLYLLIERLKKSAPDERISILFDCDKQFAPVRFQRYITARENIEDAARYLCGFTIGEPRVFLPLQAADLLAWSVRKDIIRRLGGNYESRPEFKALLQVIPGFFPDYHMEFWNEDTFAVLRNDKS